MTKKPAPDVVDDETYEIGKRDGYESAVQELDLATGGDGEFRGSTLPGGTVDVPTMKQRIIDRFSALQARPDAALAQELEAVMRGVAPPDDPQEVIALDFRLCDRILSALRTHDAMPVQSSAA